MIYNNEDLVAKHSLDKCLFNFNTIVLTKTCHFYYHDDWPQLKNKSIVCIDQPTEYMNTMYGKYSRYYLPSFA